MPALVEIPAPTSTTTRGMRLLRLLFSISGDLGVKEEIEVRGDNDEEETEEERMRWR